MSKVTLSSALFEQVGGVNWQQRPAFSPATTLSEDISALSAESFSIVTQVERTVEKENDINVSKGEAIVVLGAGLGEIWQNDVQPAWQLWQNIMQTFKWDEGQIVFFDTTHLVSEEMIFSTIEEVIELGVEWVLTMDEAHDLSEQLQEGVQVVSVPDMESMLSDPFAKRSFYHTVISTQNPH